MREEEDALFAEWRKRHQRFCPDGALDENRYLKSHPKIVFVLKETNDWAKDLRRTLLEIDRKPTWDVVGRWALDLHEDTRPVKWEALANMSAETKRSALAKTVVMNLKKSPGAGSTDEQKFRQVVRADADLILRQYRLYKPCLVVCCGKLTADCFREDVVKYKGAPDFAANAIAYWWLDGALVIESQHPKARERHRDLHFWVIDAVREVWGTQSAESAVSCDAVQLTPEPGRSRSAPAPGSTAPAGSAVRAWHPLDLVLEEYAKVRQPEFAAHGENRAWRQIHPPRWSEELHYEFWQVRGKNELEIALHNERPVKSAVSAKMLEFEGRPLPGTNWHLKWDPEFSWGRSLYIRCPLATDPGEMARAMVALIQLTHREIDGAL